MPRGRTPVRRGSAAPTGPRPAGVSGRSPAGGSTGRSTTAACDGSCSCCVNPAAAGAASARRTVVTDTPTASATACNVAPPLRRARMARAMSSVNREGPLGPRLSAARPAAPEAASSLRQRHNVTVETANAAATSNNDAALIRTSWTAASRRPVSPPASHTKHSSPRMNTRPPSSSCTSAATAPNGTPPVGVGGRGGWAVMTPTSATYSQFQFHGRRTVMAAHRGGADDAGHGSAKSRRSCCSAGTKCWLPRPRVPGRRSSSAWSRTPCARQVACPRRAVT